MNPLVVAADEGKAINEIGTKYGLTFLPPPTA